MSLIQEALRRQQEETADGTEPPAKTESEPVIRLGPKTESPASPPAPVPEPETEVETDLEMDLVLPVADSQSAEVGGLRLRSQVPEVDPDASRVADASASPTDATGSDAVRIKPTDRKSRTHKPVFHLLGVLLLLLLLLTAGAWAVVYGLQLLRREPAAPMAPVPAAAAPEAPPPLAPPAEPLRLEALPTTPPAPLPAPPPAEIEGADGAPVVDQPHIPRALPPGPTETVADTAPAEPDPVREDTVASVPTHETTPPAPDPADVEPEKPAEPEPALWPFLRVSGVVGGGHSGSAMINGQIVDVGARIDGVRLLGISGQAVRLEYQGEQRLVRVGRSTE